MPLLRFVSTFLIGATLAQTKGEGSALYEMLKRDHNAAQTAALEAKKIRMSWIEDERKRVRAELTKYQNELNDLEAAVPRPRNPRELPPNEARVRERDKRDFNTWVDKNDDQRRYAILRGTALNSLIRTLGPTAHERRMRSRDRNPEFLLPSLSPGLRIEPTDAEHYQLNPATSAGARVAIQPNRLPLEIDWPIVLIQKWKEDCNKLLKIRDTYVASLSPGADVQARIDNAELFDKSLSLLQAKAHKEKNEVARLRIGETAKNVQTHRDLVRAIDYLASIRGMAERLKHVPTDYKVLTFPGGNIEDFLDFCYMHDMVFMQSRHIDEEYYTRVYRVMQDYARDLQYVEDWREGLNRRINQLSTEDKMLTWSGIVDKTE